MKSMKIQIEFKYDYFKLAKKSFNTSKKREKEPHMNLEIPVLK